MGSYILCQVRRAENPFFIDSVSLNIYSIEELCYFICRNLPLLDETVLNESLAAWLKEELHLRRLSQKLQQLLKREHSLGDLVLPILREINYLNNLEFRDLESRIRDDSLHFYFINLAFSRRRKLEMNGSFALYTPVHAPFVHLSLIHIYFSGKE